MNFVYLHGFASGPGSTKAQLFREPMEARGIDLSIPDLAQDDFEHLTISGQLQVIDREVQERPVRSHRVQHGRLSCGALCVHAFRVRK